MKRQTEIDADDSSQSDSLLYADFSTSSIDLPASPPPSPSIAPRSSAAPSVPIEQLTLIDKKKRLNMIIIGESGIGKSSMVLQYVGQQNPHHAIYDMYSVELKIFNKPYIISIHDIGGDPAFRQHRQLVYPNADVFLLCFSVVNVNSTMQLKSLWMTEIRRQSRKVPVVLVGLQIDRRDIAEKQAKNTKKLMANTIISQKQGEKIAKDIRADIYVECSTANADRTKSISNVFNESIQLAINRRNACKDIDESELAAALYNKHRKNICIIM